jgi:hypothetical protein
MKHMVEWVKSSRQGRSGVKTPFIGKLVEEMRLQIPSAKFDRTTGIWWFDDYHYEDMQDLVYRYFPDEAVLQTVRISWDLNGEPPLLDATNLIHLSRDKWSWRDDCPIRWKVLEVDIHTGGSVRNPKVFGHLKIKAEIRLNCEITPEPRSFEVVLAPEETGSPVSVLLNDSTWSVLEALCNRLDTDPDKVISLALEILAIKAKEEASPEES